MFHQRVICKNIKTPVGKIVCTVTEQGVAQIDFDTTRIILEALFYNIEIMKHLPDAEDIFEQFEAEILDYFAQKIQNFTTPIDYALFTDKQRPILSHLSTYAPYGETISYTQLSQRVHKPGAVRTMGKILSHNPTPLLIPCHRVIKKDGKIGQYAGGVEVKKFLIDLEESVRVTHTK